MGCGPPFLWFRRSIIGGRERGGQCREKIRTDESVKQYDWLVGHAIKLLHAKVFVTSVTPMVGGGCSCLELEKEQRPISKAHAQ